MKKIFFKIAEFAHFCGTTKDTLMHYDEIGLLKPYYIGNNKYRYYEASQFETFYFISSLKDLGFSLDYIKDQMHSTSIMTYYESLKEQENILKEKIKYFKSVKKSMNIHIEELKQYLHHKNGIVFVCEMPYRHCIRSNGSVNFENSIAEGHSYFTQLLTQLKSYSKNSYHSYGFVKNREPIEQNNIFLYEHLYFHAPKEISNFIIPQGKFLSLYEQVDYESIQPNYRKLIDFADENGMKIDDTFYEDIIFSQVHAGKGDSAYIIQLRVRILE